MLQTLVDELPTSMERTATGPFRVLFVCSANLCRSVTAAEFARRITAGHPSMAWRFESAGTDVAPGQSVPSRVAGAMNKLEIPLRDRQLPLDERYARSADLILTAERYHRGVIARRYPFAVRTTFTMLEFARLVEAGRHAGTNPEGSGAGLLDLARHGRSQVQPLDDATIDIGDPVESGTSEAMLTCAVTIRGALTTIFLPGVR